MKNAFIIHGTWWNPDENWFPWMKTQLEERGYEVQVPRLPTPEGQSLENWTEAFEPFLDHIDKETIFIAHSSGPAFVLSILEGLDFPVKACYFAAGFLGLINIPDFDVLNKTITDRDFDWKKVQKNCKSFYMCHGSDDPYVPLENALMMSRNLGLSIDMIEGGGHLNSESGYREFGYLLKKI